jgi:hypothetical protein
MPEGKKVAAGVRRTYDIGVAEAWALIISAEGNELLTGRRAALAPDRTLSAWEGPPIAYELTTFAPGSHFRMSWRKSGRPSDTTLQLRVIAAPRGRATIAIHQEKLADARERERMPAHWEHVHQKIAELIAARRGGEKA